MTKDIFKVGKFDTIRVGDKIMAPRGWRSPRELTEVVKVGRLYFYVAGLYGDRMVRFYKDSGCYAPQPNETGGGSDYAQAMSIKDHADVEVRQRYMKRLDDLGVRFDWQSRWDSRATVDQLKRFLAIVEEGS